MTKPDLEEKAMNKITIIMGEYPQDCGLKKDPIEWIVLKEEHRCLCISKYLLSILVKNQHRFGNAIKEWIKGIDFAIESGYIITIGMA